jgi:hypothetical protein
MPEKLAIDHEVLRVMAQARRVLRKNNDGTLTQADTEKLTDLMYTLDESISFEWAFKPIRQRNQNN